MTHTPARAAAAVRGQRSATAVAFFTWVMRRQIAAHFHALRLARPGSPALPADRPIVIYSNHPAWWDPALYIVLAGALFPERNSYGPMDETALARYRILSRVGIFGIAPHGFQGAARFLRVARGLLAEPRNMLWLTAQGEFVDPRVRPVTLRPGLARLLARVPEALAVPMAIDYPFWSEKQPEALVRFGTPLAADDASPARLTAALTETLDALADDAIAREPARFQTLIAGRAGVGGVYDLARRVIAAARGQRFRPDHAPDDRP